MLDNLISTVRPFKPGDQGDDRQQYGEISTNMFAYVSPPLIIVTLMLFAMVIVGGPTLIVYFQTNVYLNGMIIAFLGLGVIKTFGLNFEVYNAARFVKLIEVVSDKEEPTLQDVADLKRKINKLGSLLNTAQMYETLNNIEEFGHPNFSDLNARLIKSKLGFRISSSRGDINFISGILVMFGLLGTFLGLLATIDAVGVALGSMSNIGGEGSIGMEEMSGFIGSLAAPLQGMGLAFSSSLFGLTGSLILGIFGHMSSDGQNRFIENFSRWIDDRILKFDPKLAKKMKGDKGPRVPGGDDLKTWLAGFVYLSVKTNRKMGRFLYIMAKLMEASKQSTHAISMMSEDHKAARSMMESINKNIEAVRELDAVIGDRMGRVVNSVDVIQNEMTDRTATSMNSSLRMQELSSAIQNLVETQDHIRDELKTLRATLEISENKDEDASFLVMQLNSLIEEMNSKNENLYDNIFKSKDEPDKNPPS